MGPVAKIGKKKLKEEGKWEEREEGGWYPDWYGKRSERVSGVGGKGIGHRGERREKRKYIYIYINKIKNQTIKSWVREKNNHVIEI